MNKYEFLVTAVRYDKGIAEVKSILTTIKTRFKRQTSMKYAINKVMVDLNKNTGKYCKDRFQYYSIC